MTCTFCLKIKTRDAVTDVAGWRACFLDFWNGSRSGEHFGVQGFIELPIGAAEKFVVRQ